MKSQVFFGFPILMIAGMLTHAFLFGNQVNTNPSVTSDMVQKQQSLIASDNQQPDSTQARPNTVLTSWPTSVPDKINSQKLH